MKKLVKNKVQQEEEEQEQEEQEEEEEGLPSYLQAVAGEEEATWLNLGYQP